MVFFPGIGFLPEVSDRSYLRRLGPIDHRLVPNWNPLAAFVPIDTIWIIDESVAVDCRINVLDLDSTGHHRAKGINQCNWCVFVRSSIGYRGPPRGIPG